jgi:hypothetical protein
MKLSRKATQGGVSDLNVLITEAVMLSELQEETAAKLKSVRAGIRENLEALGLERHATAAGAEALLIDKVNLTWNVEKLEELLDAVEFEDLCPRKPEASKLRKWLESCEGTPAAKEIRACAKGTKTKTLEVRAAGAATIPVAADEGRASA